MVNKKSKSSSVEGDIKKTNKKIFIIAGLVFLLLVLAGAGGESSPTPEATPSPTPEPTATATPEEKPAEPTPTPTPTPDKDALNDVCMKELFIKGYKNPSLAYMLDHSVELYDNMGYYTKDKKEILYVRGPIKTSGDKDTLYACYITADAEIIVLSVDGRELDGSYDYSLYNKDGVPLGEL